MHEGAARCRPYVPHASSRVAIDGEKSYVIMYLVGLALFLIFNVPIVEAKNNATILAFQFLTGFVGSPALATGVSIFGTALRVTSC